MADKPFYRDSASHIRRSARPAPIVTSHAALTSRLWPLGCRRSRDRRPPRAGSCHGPQGAYPRYARFPGELRGGVMTQVAEHLQTHGVPFTAIAHQQAYTSIDEARALGIEASEVVKTVAVRVAGGYALMAIPATGRLDMHLVQAAVGDRHVRLATEQELLRDFPDFELGALPPLGSLLGAPLYVDQDVLRHETVVFAAGSQTESVQLRTADLLQHEQVTALPLIKHADENDKDRLR